jgi:hypothetical protein
LVFSPGTLVSVLFLGWLLYRQLQTRPVPRQVRFQRSLMFAILGVLIFVNFLGTSQPLPPAAWAVLALSFLVGACLGVVRAYTVRLWFEDRRLLRKGTWVTVTLWLVAVTLHVLAGVLIARLHGPAAAVGSAAMLYLAMASLVQQVAVWWRGQKRREVARARAGLAG